MEESTGGGAQVSVAEEGDGGWSRLLLQPCLQDHVLATTCGIRGRKWRRRRRRSEDPCSTLWWCTADEARDGPNGCPAGAEADGWGWPWPTAWSWSGTGSTWTRGTWPRPRCWTWSRTDAWPHRCSPRHTAGVIAVRDAARGSECTETHRRCDAGGQACHAGARRRTGSATLRSNLPDTPRSRWPYCSHHGLRVWGCTGGSAWLHPGPVVHRTYEQYEPPFKEVCASVNVVCEGHGVQDTGGRRQW